MNRIRFAGSIAIIMSAAGCACDHATSQPVRQTLDWEVIPMQVGGAQSQLGGGAILLNKRTGDTWGMLNGSWQPMQRQ